MLLSVYSFSFISLLVVFHEQDSYATKLEVSQADFDTSLLLIPLSPWGTLLTSTRNLNSAPIPRWAYILTWKAILLSYPLPSLRYYYPFILFYHFNRDLFENLKLFKDWGTESLLVECHKRVYMEVGSFILSQHLSTHRQSHTPPVFNGKKGICNGSVPRGLKFSLKPEICSKTGTSHYLLIEWKD